MGGFNPKPLVEVLWAMIVKRAENWSPLSADLIKNAIRAFARDYVKAWLRHNKLTWKWVYHEPMKHDTIGWISLTRLRDGAIAATVYLGNRGGSGSVWYVWNTDGTGGENSVEPTIDESVQQAEAAVRRSGWWEDFK